MYIQCLPLLASRERIKTNNTGKHYTRSRKKKPPPLTGQAGKREQERKVTNNASRPNYLTLRCYQKEARERKASHEQPETKERGRQGKSQRGNKEKESRKNRKGKVRKERKQETQRKDRTRSKKKKPNGNKESEEGAEG